MAVDGRIHGGIRPPLEAVSPMPTCWSGIRARLGTACHVWRGSPPVRFSGNGPKLLPGCLSPTDAYVVGHRPGITSRTIVATSDTVEKVIATSDGFDAHQVTPRSPLPCHGGGKRATVPVEVFRAVRAWSLTNFASSKNP